MGFSFDDLVDRAERRNKSKVKTPFVMKMPNDEPDLVVPRPDAQKSLNFEEATTAKQQLQILLGKDFGRVWDIFKGQDVEVAQMMVTEMWSHWDGNDIVGIDGGKAG